MLASFTDGHPKVLLEAMSSGFLSIASDCEGNRSLITPGRTGLLFDARRPKDLANCLERLFVESDFATSLGRAALQLIVTCYNLRAQVSQEISLVRAIARTS